MVDFRPSAFKSRYVVYPTIVFLTLKSAAEDGVLPFEGFGVVLFDTVSLGPLLDNFSRYHRQAYGEIQAISLSMISATAGHF